MNYSFQKIKYNYQTYLKVLSLCYTEQLALVLYVINLLFYFMLIADISICGMVFKLMLRVCVE